MLFSIESLQTCTGLMWDRQALGTAAHSHSMATVDKIISFLPHIVSYDLVIKYITLILNVIINAYQKFFGSSLLFSESLYVVKNILMAIQAVLV